MSFSEEEKEEMHKAFQEWEALERLSSVTGVEAVKCTTAILKGPDRLITNLIYLGLKAVKDEIKKL